MVKRSRRVERSARAAATTSRLRLRPDSPYRRATFRGRLGTVALGREQNALVGGRLTVGVEEDCLDKLLLNVKKRTAPGGPLAPRHTGGGRVLGGVNAPLCGDNDPP